MRVRLDSSFRREMKESFGFLEKKMKGNPHVYIPLCPRGPCATMIGVVIAAFYVHFSYQLQRYLLCRRDISFVSCVLSLSLFLSLFF